MKWIYRYGQMQGYSLAIALFIALGPDGANGQSASQSLQVMKPSNNFAVAGNIKGLLRSRHLLDRQFYTDQNFLGVFGGNSVRWTSNDPVRLYATVLGSPSENIDVYWQDATDTTKRRGGIVTGPMRLTPTEVIAVFGSEFKVEDPYLNDNTRHPTPLLPATSEVGNKRYVYHEEDGKVSSDVSILFAGDGSVQRINAWQEMSK